MTWHTTAQNDSIPSTSSQEREAVFSLTVYLDTLQSERVKSNPTQEMSSSSDNVTDTCQSSPSGTTCVVSTASLGEEQLTFFAEAFPAKTSVRRVKEQELAESVRAYGKNMRDSLERCSLSLSLPKTHLCFALGDLELSSKTWPRWGIMLDGELSELGMSVRHINETECGSWPTPTCQETEHPDATLTQTGRRLSKNGKTSHSLNLADKVKIRSTPLSRIKNPEMATLGQKVAMLGGKSIPQTYPTPRCLMHKDALTDRGKSNLGEVINEREHMTKTGQLNPSWVEWLMGWPIGWTDLKPLVTDKFRNVQQWYSVFSQKD